MSQNNHKAHGPYEKLFKRLFDVVFSFLALVVLLPVLLIIAILVRIKLGSPIIFKQERPGKNEKIFKLYKFRTMTDEKDAKGKLLSDEKRLTRFGRLLRSSSLDELPELLNILKGDMSFVGPRPLLVKYLPYYTKAEHHRHDIRPGLTGLAQVSGRNYLNWEERFKTDIEYVDNVTFKEDIEIIFKTMTKVVTRKDVVTLEKLKFKDLDVARKDKTVKYTIVKLNTKLYDAHKNELYECLMQLLGKRSEAKKQLKKIRIYLEDKTAIIFCAMSNNKIVAFIWGYYISKDTIHINYFVTRVAFRGFGIGKALLSKMIDDQAINYELLVDKTNQVAHDFYKKIGFLDCGDYNDKIKMGLTERK